MKVSILFTTGRYSPVSWLIRTVTRENCSHCVIELKEGLVIHSDFRGVIVESKQQFLKRAEVIYEIKDVEINDSLENILDSHGGRLYDVLGFMYLGFRLIFPFLPKANLWQTTGMYLCTEFISKVITKKENSMITPYKLYLKLLRRN